MRINATSIVKTSKNGKLGGPRPRLLKAKETGEVKPFPQWIAEMCQATGLKSGSVRSSICRAMHNKTSWRGVTFERVIRHD